MKAARKAVPTDGDFHIVRLLADTSEAMSFASGQKIEFDFQNYTITNSGVNPIFENRGTIKISNGYLTSSTTQGAINVYSSAKLIMDGGSIVATGTKQAIYVNGGTAYLTNVASDRSAVHCINGGTLTITGGTIITPNYFGVKTENTCKLTIGVKDDVSQHNTPVIQGDQYGIYNGSSVNVKFYDGIAKGTTRGVYAENKVGKKETGYVVRKSSEMIDGVQYATYYLTKAIVVTFDQLCILYAKCCSLSICKMR